MGPSSRRDFLKRTAGFGLTAWGLSQTSWAAPPNGDQPVDMTIVRWKTGDKPADLATKLTEKAIEGLGGMGRFVKSGYTVWVKPNIGWNRAPELAANTHPDVVAALVKMSLDAGAKKVKVGDFTCNKAEDCYKNSGVGPAAEKAGAEVVYIDQNRFRDMKIDGNRLKTHPVYPEIVECDLVINVPVCKHHGSTRVSLCMKNYMGVVDRRHAFHQDLPTTIADITQFMKPKLCVLDATRILTAHGPTGGDPNDVKVLNTVAAGTDIVALDAFGSELLGNKPTDIDTVTMGQKYKLGKIDYHSLNLKEVQLS